GGAPGTTPVDSAVTRGAPGTTTVDSATSPADRPDRARRLLRGTGRLVPPVAAVAWLFPLAVLVATSLHAPRDAATAGWWSAPVGLGSYRDLLRGDRFRQSLGFTLGLAVLVTVVVLVVAVLAAYSLAGLTGSAANGTGVLLLAAAVVPIQVIAGPVNEVLGVVRLAGSAYGLALVHVT